MNIKDTRQYLALAIMFFCLAIALSLTVWPDASLAARIGHFVFGFASGITAGAYLALRGIMK